MSLTLDRLVPWGRTAPEYVRMFDLTAADLAGRVLDCGGGPASFVAAMAAADDDRRTGSAATPVLSEPDALPRVVAVDPLYRFSGSEIRARFEAVAGSIIGNVKATPGNWCWSYHKNPDGLLACRQAALAGFLSDYAPGLKRGRYRVGELPRLTFPTDSFDLALVSHLLFLYSELLSLDFHLQSIRELARVAREVRIFPLLDLSGRISPHFSLLQTELSHQGYRVETIPVNYEFQRGGNQMLRIRRAGS